MPARVYGAKASELPEVREAIREAFEPDREPGAIAPFYISYEVCDPEFRPEQYRFRRQRGRIVSALKVYTRRLRHPDGPVPVTLIGSVCTREKLRGRGLVRPVIQDSLEYSRSLGAKAEIIVTPRRNYYLRHGFKYFTTHEHTGRIPDLTLRGARIEPLRVEDAGWVTDVSNAAAGAYGPILRSEAYTRKWVLQMRLAPASIVGVKLVRRGRPAAYAVFDFRRQVMRVTEAVSRSGRGTDEVALLSFCRGLGCKRFVCHVPRSHPLVAGLIAMGVGPRRVPTQQYMYYPLDDTFPIPDDAFCHSWLDSV